MPPHVDMDLPLQAPSPTSVLSSRSSSSPKSPKSPKGGLNRMRFNAQLSERSKVRTQALPTVQAEEGDTKVMPAQEKEAEATSPCMPLHRLPQQRTSITLSVVSVLRARYGDMEGWREDPRARPPTSICLPTLCSF